MLTPLERFLRKSVGRPWDKVYGEACAALDRRNIADNHALDHLKWMVQFECYVGEDGHAYYNDWRSGRVRGFYVHPETGLLLWASWETAAERKRKAVLRKRLLGFWIDDTPAYRIIAGIWYLVTHKRVSVPWFYRRPMPALPRVWDVAERANIRLQWGDNWVATDKRQCNRAEVAEVRALVAWWERILRRPKFEMDPKLRVILAD